MHQTSRVQSRQKIVTTVEILLCNDPLTVDYYIYASRLLLNLCSDTSTMRRPALIVLRPLSLSLPASRAHNNITEIGTWLSALLLHTTEATGTVG